ncbi:hypothetical protein ACLBYD_24935 [Rhodococcus sp. C26F]
MTVNRTLAIALSIATLVLTPACGVGDDSADTTKGFKPPAEALDSAIDNARLKAFVGAFRTGFPDFANNRTDTDIERIARVSCTDIAADTDRTAVDDRIRDTVAHDGRVPDEAQIDRIYRLITPVCP